MNFSSAQIDSLLEVSQTLMRRKEARGVLEDLLDLSMETLRAERGFLVIQSENDDEPILRSARNIEAASIQERGDISYSIVTEVMSSREPVLAKNARTDPRFGGQESILIHGIQSVACVPLIEGNRSVGALYMDSRGRQDLFTRQTINYLTVVASFAALALEKALEFEKLEEQNRLWAKEITRQQGFSGIIGTSAAMTRIFDLMARMAPSHLPVMILGESGTGKELIARAIHYNSSRKDNPFMALYCGNISENLLESELFGHKRGAFTGAVETKKGMLELADGGTFLLDEVADIPINLQTKLLRFLQEGEIRPVGDNVTKKVNVRVLVATNKNLIEGLKNGAFREDLYYRLNVLSLRIPPLRERVEDIPLLSLHFLKKHAQLSGKNDLGITKKALKILQLHSWPGNVRELENVVARAVVMCSDKDIDEDNILLDQSAFGKMSSKSFQDELALKSAVKQHVLKVLNLTKGNRSEAKRLLNVSRSYLYSLIDEMKQDGIKL